MCFFLIPLTALIYLMHLPHVHKNKGQHPSFSPLHVSHQPTDWAITAGDALKGLKEATHWPANPAADVAVHLRASVFFSSLQFSSHAGFTRGHNAQSTQAGQKEINYQLLRSEPLIERKN